MKMGLSSFIINCLSPSPLWLMALFGLNYKVFYNACIISKFVDKNSLRPKNDFKRGYLFSLFRI